MPVVITDIIYIMLINMLVGFHCLLLFWFSLFILFNSLFSKFVNFHLLTIHP